MRTFHIFTAAILGTAWLDAAAQMPCAHKLDDLKVTSFEKHDEVIQHLVLSDISRMTFEDAREKYGADVIYNGTRVTGDADTFKSFKESFRQSSYTNSLRQHRSEIIKSYGDPALVDAYKACLKAQGGIYANLVPLNDKQAQLDVIYYPYPGIEGPATIKRATNFQKIKGVTVLEDGECLNLGNTLDPNITCSYVIEMDNAKTAVPFVIKTNRGSDSAYLPPRMQLKNVETEIPNRYVVNGEIKDYVHVGVPGGHITGVTACTAPLPKGYTIPVSEDNPQAVVSCINPYSCTHVLGRIETKNDRQVCFLTQCGHAGGNYTACAGRLSGKMAKLEWRPKDEYAESTSMTDPSSK